MAEPYTSSVNKQHGTKLPLQSSHKIQFKNIKPILSPHPREPTNSVTIASYRTSQSSGVESGVKRTAYSNILSPPKR